MSLKQVDFSKVLNDDQVYDLIIKNYSLLGKDWIAHQWNWMNGIYLPFKDHYKYIIIISLIEKTLQFYDQMNIRYSYDQFYSKSYLQIEKFSITELCEKLNLPKETVRRKVLELEKMGVLKRLNKQVMIDRSVFSQVKPERQIKITSKYIHQISELLNKKKIYLKKLNSKLVEDSIKKNFSLCWRWFYRMQIPMVTRYHSIFGDVPTFHVWGTVAMNQAFNYQKSVNGSNIYNLATDHLRFSESIIMNEGSAAGVSAMSISDMTNIPRATVVRKCKYLLEHKYLKINENKQYIMTGINIGNILPYQKKIFRDKSKFIRKTLNLFAIS
jgi:hypothetical protein